MAQSIVLWFTGLPASGKTTLARGVQERLRARGRPAVLIDSDAMRPILTPEPTYTAAEREFFYAALAGLAAWLNREGVDVLVAATAHLRRYRAAAREQIPAFAEVFVATPLAVCRERDPKGLYAAADAGRIDALPGAGAPYEPPLTPEWTVDLSTADPDEAADAVVRWFFNGTD